MYQNVHCDLLQKNFSIQGWPLYKGLVLEKYSECFFMFGAILKATNSSFQKGMAFCRSVYVKKNMKLLAFIFEQPSYVLLFLITSFRDFWSHGMIITVVYVISCILFACSIDFQRWRTLETANRE